MIGINSLFVLHIIVTAPGEITLDQISEKHLHTGFVKFNIMMNYFQIFSNTIIIYQIFSVL